MVVIVIFVFIVFIRLVLVLLFHARVHMLKVMMDLLQTAMILLVGDVILFIVIFSVAVRYKILGQIRALVGDALQLVV